MLGCPARNAKTLVITENEELARRLVFVISYFIRCSQIFERKLKFSESDLASRKYRIKKNDLKKIQIHHEDPTLNKSSNLSKSSSSPTLEPKNLQNITMKKSKSFICSLSDMSESDPQTSEVTTGPEKVNFLIGENENLEFDLFMDKKSEIKDQDKEKKRVRIDDEVTITKGISVTMTDADVDNEVHDYIEITEVPLPECEIISSEPASMPSLICCNDQYMAGTVLQVVIKSLQLFLDLDFLILLKGCFGQKDEAWRSALQTDLLATANNHFVAGASEESICIVGDCIKNEVRKQTSCEEKLPDHTGEPGVCPADSGWTPGWAAHPPLPPGGRDAGHPGQHRLIQPACKCGSESA